MTTLIPASAWQAVSTEQEAELLAQATPGSPVPVQAIRLLSAHRLRHMYNEGDVYTAADIARHTAHADLLEELARKERRVLVIYELCGNSNLTEQGRARLFEKITRGTIGRKKVSECVIALLESQKDPGVLLTEMRTWPHLLAYAAPFGPAVSSRVLTALRNLAPQDLTAALNELSLSTSHSASLGSACRTPEQALWIAGHFLTLYGQNHAEICLQSAWDSEVFPWDATDTCELLVSRMGTHVAANVVLDHMSATQQRTYIPGKIFLDGLPESHKKSRVREMTRTVAADTMDDVVAAALIDVGIADGTSSLGYWNGTCTPEAVDLIVDRLDDLLGTFDASRYSRTNLLPDMVRLILTSADETQMQRFGHWLDVLDNDQFSGSFLKIAVQNLAPETVIRLRSMSSVPPFIAALLVRVYASELRRDRVRVADAQPADELAPRALQWLIQAHLDSANRTQTVTAAHLMEEYADAGALSESQRTDVLDMLTQGLSDGEGIDIESSEHYKTRLLVALLARNSAHFQHLHGYRTAIAVCLAQAPHHLVANADLGTLHELAEHDTTPVTYASVNKALDNAHSTIGDTYEIEVELVKLLPNLREAHEHHNLVFTVATRELLDSGCSAEAIAAGLSTLEQWQGTFEQWKEATLSLGL